MGNFKNIQKYVPHHENQQVQPFIEGLQGGEGLKEGDGSNSDEDGENNKLVYKREYA